jgi:hypothetical protein
MAYDEGREKLFVYDGANTGATVSSFWEWDPVSVGWSLRDTADTRDYGQAVAAKLGGLKPPTPDIHGLSRALSVPALVVVRHAPRMDRVKRALLGHVPGGERKWRLIEQAGPPEPLGKAWVQRANLTLAEARDLLQATTLSGTLPEPLRLAHIIAGGVGTGTSHGRA